MNTTFTYNNQEIKLSAFYKTTVNQKSVWPNSKEGLISFKYLIKIDVKGNSITFDYYGSHDQYTKGDKNLSEKDLMFAFYCFLSDAQCAMEDIRDFMDNLGYEDFYIAEEVYEKCTEQLEKYEELFSIDIYDFLNWMQENEYC